MTTYRDLQQPGNTAAHDDVRAALHTLWPDRAPSAEVSADALAAGMAALLNTSPQPAAAPARQPLRIGALVAICAAYALALIALLWPAGQSVTRDATAASAALDAVTRAITVSADLDTSQRWLANELTHDVDRAWFVRSDGLIALSSVTTSNELSRSVVAFLEGAAAGDLAALPAISRTAPVIVDAVVARALLRVAGPNARVVTQPVHDRDGRWLGVAGAALKPHARGSPPWPAIALAAAATLGLLALLVRRPGDVRL
jgi:hypothetical protein